LETFGFVNNKSDPTGRFFYLNPYTFAVQVGLFPTPNIDCNDNPVIVEEEFCVVVAVIFRMPLTPGLL
jgi:hypothetical protein